MHQKWEKNIEYGCGSCGCKNEKEQERSWREESGGWRKAERTGLEQPKGCGWREPGWELPLGSEPRPQQGLWLSQWHPLPGWGLPHIEGMHWISCSHLAKCSCRENPAPSILSCFDRQSPGGVCNRAPILFITQCSCLENPMDRE